MPPYANIEDVTKDFESIKRKLDDSGVVDISTIKTTPAP